MTSSVIKNSMVLAAALLVTLAFGASSVKADPGCGGRYYYGGAPVYYSSCAPTYYAYRSCPPPVYYYAPAYVVRDCAPAPYYYRGGGISFSFGRSYRGGYYRGGGGHHSRHH